jgi:3-oxoacyl-[acyl-carrier protein] reductase
MSGLEGRVAVVTGASQGIGREIALALARAGSRVKALARGADRLEETASQAKGLPGAVEPVVCDVSDPHQVASAAKSILDEVERLDFLVNNAGITRDGLLVRMKDKDWSDVLGTNLTSAFFLSRAFLPGMIRGRFGRIVNISSVVATAGNPGQTNYAASKAALLGFTRSLAREIASRHITVNAVAPGYIATPMTEALPERARTALLSQIPLGSLGVPADVSASVLFLLGDGGRYITGQVLHVNGGMYM